MLFGFRNFETFKTRILIALNIKKERTHVGPLQVITSHQPTTVDKEPKKGEDLPGPSLDVSFSSSTQLTKNHKENREGILSIIFLSVFYFLQLC